MADNSGRNNRNRLQGKQIAAGVNDVDAGEMDRTVRLQSEKLRLEILWRMYCGDSLVAMVQDQGLFFPAVTDE